MDGCAGHGQGRARDGIFSELSAGVVRRVLTKGVRGRVTAVIVGVRPELACLVRLCVVGLGGR